MRPLVLEAWLPKARWLVISSGERFAETGAWWAALGAAGQTAFQGWLVPDIFALVGDVKLMLCKKFVVLIWSAEGDVMEADQGRRSGLLYTRELQGELQLLFEI